MKDQAEADLRAASKPQFRPRAERIEIGKSLRDKLPRATHATWEPPANHRDPIDVLEESNQNRLPELIPIRYGRMQPPYLLARFCCTDVLGSGFSANYRDSQACGDCHGLNFDFFATPERNLVFDLKDSIVKNKGFNYANYKHTEDHRWS